MGALLLIPFLLIRFGLLAVLGRNALRRAAHFAPLTGGERPAYWLYQLATAAIFVVPFFLRVRLEPAPLFYAGLAVYLAGAALMAAAMVNFARPAAGGINQRGLYAISRNPIYVAYFLYFIGCVLLTQSIALLSVVLTFQITAHWIIKAEERWCLETFGDAYRQYMRRVRRYL